MPFIGIIADEKEENAIRRKIVDGLNLRESNVLFIKEKTAENVRNIRFETIILAKQFDKMDILQKMLKNTNYLIINTDRVKNQEVFEQFDLNTYSFGFNSKADITASSVTDDGILMCISRELQNADGKAICPQEIKIDSDDAPETVMATEATLLIYDNKNKYF